MKRKPRHAAPRYGLAHLKVWACAAACLCLLALPGPGLAQPGRISALGDLAETPTATAAATLAVPTATITPGYTLPAPTATPQEPTLLPPTATQTPTPTWAQVQLPLVLKHLVGPTATPTLTRTPSITPTPTITLQPTPAITEGYGTLSISGPVTDRPAAQHADLNLSLRSYQPTQAALVLIDMNGGTDPGAPQLASLCTTCAEARLVSAFQVYQWDWARNARGSLITWPPVTLLGLAARRHELLRVPQSGYSIGDGYQVLVLYARSDAITLKYTREDNVVRGYTLHLEGIQVDPALVALYERQNQAGRSRLPALRGGQALGWAVTDEVRVAVRDCGCFMEPRSRKDWWRGY